MLNLKTLIPQSLLFWFIILPGISFGQAFSVTVNTTDDTVDARGCTSQHCSYREALNLANGFQGEMFIFFNIPGNGSERRIELTDNLPAISNFGQLTVDGSSQSNAQVVIDGNGRFNYGLHLESADNTVVDGLTFDNLRLAGIYIESASDACVIGTTKNGNTFTDSRYGAVIEGTNALLRNNVFDNNDINGVFVTADGSATIGEQGNSAANNTFLNHRFAGVEVNGGTEYVTIFGNSFYCNEAEGITNFNSSNNGIEKPIIKEASTTSISGTADRFALVQVYIFDPNQKVCNEVNTCQGQILLGSVEANGSGVWTLDENSFSTPLLSSYQLTATQTERIGVVGAGFLYRFTSEFADCFSLCDIYSISLSSNGPPCPGDSFVITPSITTSGNNPEPLTFRWSGPNNFTSSEEEITAEVEGTYTLIATNSCNNIEVSIVIQAQETAPASITATYNGPICEFDTLQLFASTARVIYEWTGKFGFNSNEQNPIVNLAASSLRSGTYYLTTKTPINGCPGPSDSVEVLVKAPPILRDTSLNACIPANVDPIVASFDLTSIEDYIKGGDSTVTLFWFEDEALERRITFPEGYQSGTGSVFVVGFDTLGCQSELVKIPLTIFTQFDIDLRAITEVTCANPNGGSLLARISSGTEPFIYEWSDSTLTGNNPINLSSGTYVLTVTGANGCMNTASITLNDPPVIKLNCQVIRDITRVGANDGQVEISFGGGTAPYRINIPAWNDTSFTSTDDGLVVLTGLPPGIYETEVVDNNGCSQNCEFEIKDIDCSGFQLDLVITPVNCPGTSTGAIVSRISGGQAPFDFNWSDDNFDDLSTAEPIGAGNYGLTVTDNLGCEVKADTLVTEPEEIILNCVVTRNPSQAGSSDGQAEITLSGGTVPYVLRLPNWNDTMITVAEASTILLQGLPAGSFSPQLTDNNNCTRSCNFEIEAIDCSTFNLALNITNIDCAGANNGRIEAIVSGGEAPYRFDWSQNDFDGENIASGLSAGPYGLTLTDAVGCVISQDTLLAEPNAIIVSCATIQDITQVRANDGIAQIRISNGIAPYTLSIPALNDTMIQMVNDGVSTLNNLPPGLYTVLVTDTNGCTQNCAFEIEAVDCSGFSVELAVFPTACPETSTGLISADAIGGQAPFIYDWSADNFDGQSSIDQLGLGVYGLTLTDAALCTASASAEIIASNRPPSLSIGSYGSLCPGNCVEVPITFTGIGPFLLNYQIEVNGEIINQELQSSSSVSSISVCAVDFPEETTLVNLTFLELSDANCSSSFAQNASIVVQEAAFGVLDTVLCRGNSLLINGTEYDENNPFGRELFSGATRNGCDSILEINAFFPSAPELSNRQRTCDLTNNTFVLSFDLLGLAPFVVEGVSGQVFGDQFVSDPLPADGSFDVRITDGFGCGNSFVVEAPDCSRENNCSVKAGTLVAFAENICQYDQFSLMTLGDEQLDSNQLQLFVIHNGSENELGAILSSSTDGNFSFENPLVLGQSYFTAVLAGRNNGFGRLDLEDPCLDIFLGGPVQFDASPRRPLYIQGQDTLCVGEDLILSTEAYPQEGLRYNWITPFGDTIQTDTNSVSIPNITQEDAGTYAVFVQIGNCTSPVFMPHQLVVINFPILYAGDDQETCGLNQIRLQADPISFGIGTWSTPTGSLIIDSSDPLTTVRELEAGVNPFIWTVAANNCISHDTVYISYFPAPILVDDELELEPGLSRITFDAFANDGVEGLVLDENTVQIVSQPDIGMIRYLPEDQVFEYTAELSNEEAVAFEYAICPPECPASCDTAFVIINLPDVVLDVPEGIIRGRANDGLKIGNLEAFPENEVIITNRWGVAVYKQQNYSNDNPWRGTHNGADLPQGTYYLYLRIEGRKSVVTKAIHLIVR